MLNGVKPTYRTGHIWSLLSEVTDPEIPVLNVVEMGIVRGIEMGRDEIVVRITPTYSGCPAMNAIETDIRKKLQEKGIENIRVKTDYSETWTTDWMTDEAKRKLKEYGIEPPEKTDPETPGDYLSVIRKSQKIVPCPYCDSLETELQSEFGSTACKAQYYCHSCAEPFEYFKCI